MNEFGLQYPDDPRSNIYGGAIAFGHPLASSGIRLACHLMHGFAAHPEVKYGLTTMCVGLGRVERWSGEPAERDGKGEEKEEHMEKKKKKEELKDKEKKKKRSSLRRVVSETAPCRKGLPRFDYTARTCNERNRHG